MSHHRLSNRDRPVQNSSKMHCLKKTKKVPIRLFLYNVEFNGVQTCPLLVSSRASMPGKLASISTLPATSPSVSSYL